METQPRPIGGWLIVVILGLALTPLRLGVHIVTVDIPFFTSETWKALTTPGRAAYHPLWAPFLIIELLGNAAFCIWAVVLFWPLFKRKRAFPRLVIIFLVANLTFVLVDLLVASRISGVRTIPPRSDARSNRIG